MHTLSASGVDRSLHQNSQSHFPPRALRRSHLQLRAGCTCATFLHFLPCATVSAPVILPITRSDRICMPQLDYVLCAKDTAAVRCGLNNRAQIDSLCQSTCSLVLDWLKMRLEFRNAERFPIAQEFVWSKILIWLCFHIVTIMVMIIFNNVKRCLTKFT